MLMQNMTQADLEVGMKEKHNGVLSHSDGYCKETDSMSINMTNLQHFNSLGKETVNSVHLKREGGGFQTSSELEHSKVVNHVIDDTKSGGGDSLNENDLGEVLHNQLGTKGSKTRTSDEENRDKVLNGPETESFMALYDCANHDEDGLPGSGAQIIASRLFLADSSLYTDKSVMECEMDLLIVCCKDIDCQHVKDICVDKGEPLEEKGLIDKHPDNCVAPHVSKPSIKYVTNEKTGNLYYKFHIPDSLTSPAETNFDDLTVDRCEAKEERKVISPVLNESECLPEGNVKENGPIAEVFMHSSEKNVGNKIEKYVLVQEPLVTSMVPSEMFGTKSCLQSIMDSLNSQGEEITKQSNQSMTENPSRPDGEFESEELNHNDADNITLDFRYESPAVDSRDMSDEVSEKPWNPEDVLNHNFRNITDPLTAREVMPADMDKRDDEYALDNKFRDSSNPFLVTEIQSSGKHGSTTDMHHETRLKNMGGHSNNPFGVDVRSAIVEVSTEENLPTTIVNHKGNLNPFALNEIEVPSTAKDSENIDQGPAESPTRSTNNPFADCEVENADLNKNCESIYQQPELSNSIADTNNPFSVEANGIQSSDEQPELINKGDSYNPFTNCGIEGAGINKINGNPTVPEQQSFTLRDLHNLEGAPKYISLTDPGESGIGETSFSAVSGRITYSGPIQFSGSTSLRSDSSTTSTRSFAFPVLQSEWNSSPVRMERADRRKQRGGWKHGILCCKF